MGVALQGNHRVETSPRTSAVLGRDSVKPCAHERSTPGARPPTRTYSLGKNRSPHKLRFRMVTIHARCLVHLSVPSTLKSSGRPPPSEFSVTNRGVPALPLPAWHPPPLGARLHLSGHLFLSLQISIDESASWGLPAPSCYFLHYLGHSDHFSRITIFQACYKEHLYLQCLIHFNTIVVSGSAVRLTRRVL